MDDEVLDYEVESVSAAKRTSSPLVVPPEDDDLRRALSRQRVKDALFGGGAKDVHRLGRFHLVRPLGEGGMGIVYLGWDPDLEREVAIKVLRDPAAGEESSLRKRLVREAKLLARFSHPNVVQAFEVGVDAGRLFIVMEHIKGRTLRRWLDESSGSWQDVLGVMLQAGSALVAAHGRGLVHRDFKPENVMIDEWGRVRVLDFGLARDAADAGELESLHATIPEGLPESLAKFTATGSVLGTPAYMAPEQHRGLPATPQSDQFAFCVTLFEGLYASHPFDATSYPQLVASVLEGRHKKLTGRGIPPRVARAIARGLRPQASARHASMAALLAELDLTKARRRGRLWVSAAVGLGLAGTAYATSMAGTDPVVQLCENGESRSDSAWEDFVPRIAANFDIAGAPEWVGNSWRVFSRNGDDYVADWRAAHTRTCEGLATETLALQEGVARLDCLEARFNEFDATVSTILSMDPRVWAQGFRGWVELDPVSVCENDAALRSYPSLPRDPAIRTVVQQARREIIAGLTYASAREFHAATQAYERAASIARELEQDFLFAELAHARWFLRLIETQDASITANEELRERAIELAEVSAHDRLMLELLMSAPELPRRRRALGILDRLGSPALFRVDLAAELFPSDSETGKALLTRVREAARSEPAKSGGYIGVELLNTRRQLSHILGLEESEPAHAEFCDWSRDSLGKLHPRTVQEVGNRARDYCSRGEFEKCAQTSRVFFADIEFDPSHPTLSRGLIDLAGFERTAGQFRAAERTIVDFLGKYEGASVVEAPFHDAAEIAIWLAEFRGTAIDVDSLVSEVRDLESRGALAEDRVSAAHMAGALFGHAARRAGPGSRLPAYPELPSSCSSERNAEGCELSKAWWTLYGALEVGDLETARSNLPFAQRDLLLMAKNPWAPRWQRGELRTRIGRTHLLSGNLEQAREVLELAREDFQGVPREVSFICDADFYLSRVLSELDPRGQGVLIRELAGDAAKCYAGLGPGRVIEKRRARELLESLDSLQQGD